MIKSLENHIFQSVTRMKILSTWKLLRTTWRIRIRSPFVRRTPLTYRTRNFPPPAPLPENTKHREYFPGCFPPFTGITYYRVRAHRTPRIALLYFVMLCLLCIHYFFPPLLSGRLRDRRCCWPVRLRSWRPLSLARETRQAPPPLITRYRLFFSILLALE